MTDKVQKIRQEVEKLKFNLIHGACSSQVAMETRCKEEAYNDVLALLDTTQEEPTSWLEEFKAKVDSMSKEDFKKIFDKYAIDFEEEPVSDDLEEAAKEYSGKSSHPLNNAFKAGANWQKQKDSIVSEDLEEAADNALSNVLNTHEIVNVRSCLEMFKSGAKWQKTKDESTTEDLGEYINELSKQFPEVSFAKLSRIAVRVSRWQRNQDTKNKLPKVINRTDLDEFAYQCAYDLSNDWAIDNPTWHDVEDACKLGAKWQKEQDQSTIELAEDHAMFAGMEKMKEEMMEKAVDAELYSDGMLTPLIGVNDKEVMKDVKFGDKIKLIIIKDKKDV